MTRRRICLSDSLGEHCRGGPGSLHFYSSVMTPHSVYPVREFTVSEVRPYAQHDRSVTITFIEPRKRKKKYTTVVPDNVRYVAIEANGEFVYDSRADVPCHMGDFRATRARFDIQDADEGPPEPEPPVKPMTRAEMHTHAIAEKEGVMTEDRSDELA